jgi:hypothetical protein
LTLINGFQLNFDLNIPTFHVVCTQVLICLFRPIHAARINQVLFIGPHLLSAITSTTLEAFIFTASASAQQHFTATGLRLRAKHFQHALPQTPSEFFKSTPQHPP